MISIKFSQFMEGNYSDDEWWQLYIIRRQTETLYVGISRANVWNRWFGSRSSHMYFNDNNDIRGSSRIGREIEEHLPESLDWIIELFTFDDCMAILKEEFDHGPWKRFDLELAEVMMIKIKLPSHNRIGNWYARPGEVSNG